MSQSNGFSLAQLKQGEFSLTGNLVRSTLSKKSAVNFKKLLSGPSLLLDLGSLGRIDTAGLAWLLLLIEQANQKNIVISFRNLSVELTKLAKLSAVDTLFQVNS